jgi:flagellar biosynthetic protein FlhB
LLVLAALDYMYQRLQFEKSVRMTRAEVREEMRQSEGDPTLRARIRQRQRQLARQRMMQDVPRADVVITNPTHVAIALRYDANEMRAPQVIAKGQRLIAERIRDMARQHGIPIVENKPLAQTLFKSVDVGQEIPAELYQAVAEILAFVYRLRRGV